MKKNKCVIFLIRSSLSPTFLLWILSFFSTACQMELKTTSRYSSEYENVLIRCTKKLFLPALRQLVLERVERNATNMPRIGRANMVIDIGRKSLIWQQTVWLYGWNWICIHKHNRLRFWGRSKTGSILSWVCTEPYKWVERRSGTSN